jgi:hypothetical protein
MIRAHIRPAIESALNEKGMAFQILPPNDATALRRSLASRFCGSDDPMALHWRSLLNYNAVQHPDAWRWVDEFLQGRAVFLFTYEDDEPAVFSLGSGTSVSAILGECSVSGPDTSFLLCENEYDYLFGAGSAKGWITKLMPRHKHWVARLNDMEREE